MSAVLLLVTLGKSSARLSCIARAYVCTGAGIGVIFAFATAPKAVSVFDNPSLHVWELMFILSTMGTNIWATSLIAYRAWFVIFLHLQSLFLTNVLTKGLTTEQSAP